MPHCYAPHYLPPLSSPSWTGLWVVLIIFILILAFNTPPRK